MRLTNWLQAVFCRTSSSRLQRGQMGRRSEQLEARLVLAAPHPFDSSLCCGTRVP